MPKESMIVVESYRKYPRRITRVFINFMVFTKAGKGIQAFTIARVWPNDKFIWRLTQAEEVMIVVESYRKYPRKITRVFINFIVFTRVGKGF